MLQTLFVLGLVLVGVAGVRKLSTIFTSTRAQVAALVVYAASPLIGGSMSSGRLTVLVVYAATPWIVHLMRRSAGISTGDPRLADDVADGLVDLDTGERIRRTVLTGLVLALAVAFAPVMLPVALLLAVVLALGTLLAGASWRTAMWFFVTGVGAGIVAALLNLPWIVVVDLGGSRRRPAHRVGGVGSGVDRVVRDRGHRLRGARPGALRPGRRCAPPRPSVAPDLGGTGGFDGGRVRCAGRAGRPRFVAVHRAAGGCAAGTCCAGDGDLRRCRPRGVRPRRPRRIVRLEAAARHPRRSSRSWSASSRGSRRWRTGRSTLRSPRCPV